jgi:hypothetical protein
MVTSNVLAERDGNPAIHGKIHIKSARGARQKSIHTSRKCWRKSKAL